MPTSFMEHLVVPVADAEDARITATALESMNYGQVTAVHVVEKADGVPDKLPVEQAEARAEAAVATFQDVLPDADARITYGTDVVEAIDEVAGDEGATAVAFRPRDGNRIVQLLSGDHALRLMTEPDRPVIAFEGATARDSTGTEEGR